MTPNEELLTGLAELLSAAGIGSWSGAAVDVGTDVVLPVIVVDGPIPWAPDRVIRLRAYNATAMDYSTGWIVGVQVAMRGTPHAPGGSLFTMTDGVLRTLHGLRNVTLGTAPNERAISQCLFQSGTALGEDTSGRPEEVMNFYVYMDVADPAGKTG